MTKILQVITEYCSLYVDDIRLSDLASTDMPLYARRMYQYLKAGLPLFSIPTEMQSYLVGDKYSPNLIEPKIDSALYQTTKDYNDNFEINLGEEYKGYELYSCRVREINRVGDVLYTPISADYDADTGIMTVKATADNPIMSGTVLDLDFYTDGYFVNDLTPTIMSIIGTCFQVVWQDRFNTDWLSMVSKIEDKSFTEQNRANKMKADTERLTQLRQKLYGEMRRYEQNLYQNNIIKNSAKPII